MDPAQAEAQFQQAVAAYRGGDFPGAARLCEELLAFDPEHPAVLQLAGATALRQGRTDDAVQLFTAAVAAKPDDAGAQVNLGAALKAAHRLTEAAAAYREATVLAPENATAWYDLGNALQALGNDGEAADSYRRVLSLKPEHEHAAFNLGVLLLARDEPTEAAQLLAQVARQHPNSAAAQARLGFALRRAGNTEAAIDALRRALALDANDVDAMAMLATTLGEQGGDGLDQAAGLYRRALALAPARAEIWSNLAWTLAEIGQLDAALNAANEATRRDPELPAGHYHLGLIQQRRNALAEAEAALRQAIALNPRYVRAYSTLALVLESQGRHGDVAAIADPARVVQGFALDELIDVSDVDAFNRELVAFIHRTPTLMAERPNRATTGGAQTLDLAQDQAAVVQTFRDGVNQAVKRYLAARREAGPDGYFQTAPEHWELSIWAVVLASGGYQAPHNHPTGFISGVYYPKVPSVVGTRGEDGYIEFGPSNVTGPDGRQLASGLRMTARPQEGRMFLFPSYLWHRTIPCTSDEERISVAFDVLWR